MNEEMKFPETLDEFIKQYSFIDNKQFYTNGSELIQTFRVKQWEEHKEKENNQLKHIIDELEKWLKGYWELLSGMPDIQEQAQMDILHEVSDKIKELKGNKEV